MSNTRQGLHGICLTYYADDGTPLLYETPEERDGIDAAILWDDDTIEEDYDDE